MRPPRACLNLDIMKNLKPDRFINIEIDGLTNSIQNLHTGQNHETEIQYITKNDFKQLTRRAGWRFNWKAEIKYADRSVYKLITIDLPYQIQGLVSLSDHSDHIYLHLVESAPFNLGKNKVFLGVPGNLIAFACKLSQNLGYQGFVAFQAKTILIRHYEQSLGATHIGGQKMIIYPHEAAKLIQRYFKS